MRLEQGNGSSCRKVRTRASVSYWMTLGILVVLAGFRLATRIIIKDPPLRTDMLKVFRNIRRRMVISNSFGNYLLYALGEVVLVVIGILIALQINNWNELRKTRLFEVKMLKETRKSLTQDLDMMDM